MTGHKAGGRLSRLASSGYIGKAPVNGLTSPSQTQRISANRATAAVDKGEAVLRVVQKIPMFGMLSRESASLILRSCEFRSAGTGDTVFKINQPSDDLCILLSGRLQVLDKQMMEIAEISPVAPVGEMGLITGQPRSATVRARESSRLLVLKKVAFERLTRQNPEVCRHVFANVVQILEQRLAASCDRCAQGEQELRVLESELADIHNETEALSEA